MQIKYLGHAGFKLTTESVVLYCDPWLSNSGAFDSAWFQFPQNHHLFAIERDAITDSRKPHFIYLSHEHKDHFDVDFLSVIVTAQPTIIIPRYETSDFYELICELGFKNVQQVNDGDSIRLGCEDAQASLSVRLFVEDGQINRDSAILVTDELSGKKFLNLNDCKIFDRLPRIAKEEGNIEVFTAQFSGATWHPVCYEYDEDTFVRLSKAKRMSKFVSILNALKVLEPLRYFPSAGPACFLDPGLFHINFQKENVFPHQFEIRDFLVPRLEHTAIDTVIPGDVYDTELGEFTNLVDDRPIEPDDINNHLLEYQNKRAHLFSTQNEKAKSIDLNELLEDLRTELQFKLDNFHPKQMPDRNIFYSFLELPNEVLCIDFGKHQVTVEKTVPETNYYHQICPAWEIKRVLTREITWEDFALTFRMRIRRDPDKYDTLINGFLFSEARNLPRLVTTLETIRDRKERIIVSANGRQFEIDRYCPHQGADLQHGYANDSGNWICPRHRWEYELDCGGQCTTSRDSINARPI